MLFQAAVARRTKALKNGELKRPRWRWVEDAAPKPKVKPQRHGDDDSNSDDSSDDEETQVNMVAKIASEGTRVSCC